MTANTPEARHKRWERERVQNTRIGRLWRRFGRVMEVRCGECALYFARDGRKGWCELVNGAGWDPGWQACNKFEAKKPNE
jgi:hypothetical protein